MNKQEPLVSVGIPTYNRPSGFKKTLKCITSQTYKNLEIIVSDNCSPGKQTTAIVCSFQKKDKRIKYFRQKSNQGLRFNAKFVLEKATGKYFMWAADDDSWAPDFILELVHKLEKHPEAGVAMSGFKIIFPTTVQTIRFHGQYNPNLKGFFGNFWIALHYPRSKNYLFFCGIFKRKLLQQTFPKLANFYATDIFFMIFFSLVASFQYVDKILFFKTLDSSVKFKEESNRIRKFRWWGDFSSIFKLALAILFSPQIPWSRKLYIPIELLILLFRLLMHLLIAFFWYIIIFFNWPIIKINKFRDFLIQRYIWLN